MDSDNILANITDEDLGLSKRRISVTKSTRVGARVILFDDNSRVALVYEYKYDHYKLPGGNIEHNETVEQAVQREAKEEVGCKIKNLQYLGVVYSHLNQYSEDCWQYYFMAQVDGAIGESEWIDEEELHGCSIIWCAGIDEAISKVQSGTSEEYVHLFEKARELAGLRAVTNE